MEKQRSQPAMHHCPQRERQPTLVTMQGGDQEIKAWFPASVSHWPFPPRTRAGVEAGERMISSFCSWHTEPCPN